MKKIYKFLIIYYLYGIIKLNAQPITIVGQVIDKETKQPIAFVSVYLKNSKKGMLTNEVGNFLIESVSDDDTLYVSFLSYKTYKKSVKNLTTKKATNVNIELELIQNNVDVSDVIPTSPENYLQNCYEALFQNIDTMEYESLYKVQTKCFENSHLVFTETFGINGIHKPYNRKIDRIYGDFQLKHYSRKGTDYQVSFMKNEKINLKYSNSKDSIHKKKEVTMDELISEMSVDASLSMPYQIYKAIPNFIKPTNFKNYNYTLQRDCKNDSLMIIYFKSKKKKDNQFEQGQLFINCNSWFIEQYRFTINVDIPFYVKPILFFMGYNFKDMSGILDIEFQNINSKYYLLNKKYVFNGVVIKNKYMLEKYRSQFTLDYTTKVKLIIPGSQNKILPKNKFNFSKRNFSTQITKQDSIQYQKFD